MLRGAIIVPGQSPFRLSDFRLEPGQMAWNGICYTSPTNRNQPEGDSVSPSPEIISMISDLLIILDPAYCNFEFLSRAVRNGCHLFLTDRLRMTSEERRELILLADEGGTSIQIRNDLLFHPFRDTILSDPALPCFVEIHQETKLSAAHYRDLLFNNLLMILRITGHHVHRMHVFGSAFPDQPSGLINLHLNFTNGSAASVTLSFSTDHNQHQLMVHKSGQTLRFDLSEKPLQPTSNGTGSFNRPDDPLILQVNDFIHKISTCSTPFFSLKEELTACHLMEKIITKLEIQSVLI